MEKSESVDAQKFSQQVLDDLISGLQLEEKLEENNKNDEKLNQTNEASLNGNIIINEEIPIIQNQQDKDLSKIKNEKYEKNQQDKNILSQQQVINEVNQNENQLEKKLEENNKNDENQITKLNQTNEASFNENKTINQEIPISSNLQDQEISKIKNEEYQNQIQDQNILSQQQVINEGNSNQDQIQKEQQIEANQFEEIKLNQQTQVQPVQEVQNIANQNSLEKVQEEYKFVENLKQQKILGNELFKQKKYSEALKQYQNTVQTLNNMECGNSTQPDDFEQLMLLLINEIEIPCNSNIALCYQKQNNHAQAIHYASEVLNIDHSNIKALYRRGTSYLQQNQFELAEIDFKKAYQLDPSDKITRQALINLKKQRQKYQTQSKKMSEKIISDCDYSKNVQTQSKLKFISQILSSKIIQSVKNKALNIKDQIKQFNSKFEYSIKLIFLIPFALVSEKCCKRRLSSSFFKK